MSKKIADFDVEGEILELEDTIDGSSMDLNSFACKVLASRAEVGIEAKLADQAVKSSEVFMTGFLQNNNYVGRPVDVEFMNDGSMLVSDDWNGAIYRISYGKAHTASR